MNGPIAQIVALSLHGNAALAGAGSTDFIAQNSTAQFCQSIDFLREEPKWFGLGTPERRIMSSPEQWFDDLRNRKAVRVGVRWLSGKEKSASDRHSYKRVSFDGYRYLPEMGKLLWFEMIAPSNWEQAANGGLRDVQ